jgi:SagB-type dehydrogenase family enzyme
MKLYKIILTVITGIAFIICLNTISAIAQPVIGNEKGLNINLPAPKFDGNISVEKALLNRRSIRDYQYAPVSLAELSQLLWAAQGITDTAGRRTAPSAGSDYSLTLFVVAGNVSGLNKGLYQYYPKSHSLGRWSETDLRPDIYQISLNQLHILNAPFLIIYTEDKNISKVYAKKAEQKVNTEVGAALQNVYLQGTALGLGVAVSTSWDEAKLKDLIKIGSNYEPLIIQTVGKKK